MVSELICYDKTWNKSLVYQAFDKEETDAIVRIPLAPIKRSDVMVWKFTPHGRYRDNSAYSVASMAR